MKSAYFEVNGQPFHGHIAGDPDAPLMLFLHGFPEYCGAWDDILPAFADKYFCLAPDQRGYGQSWRPAEATAYETRHLVADALAMMDLFGGGRAAAVVGHDWGAAVAYALAIRAPDRLDKLVVMNGAHPLPFQRALAAGGAQSMASQYIDWLRRDGSEQVLAANDFEKLLTLFAEGMDLSWLTGARADAYKAAWRDADGLRGMVNWYRASPVQVARPGQPIPDSDLPQWPAQALRVTMPHLLLWGEKDTALLPESREGLSDLCDALHIQRNPQADHWINHTHSEWVIAQISAFLDN